MEEMIRGEVNSGMFVFSSGNTAVIPVATILCVSFVSLRIPHSGAFRVRKMVPGIPRSFERIVPVFDKLRANTHGE